MPAVSETSCHDNALGWKAKGPTHRTCERVHGRWQFVFRLLQEFDAARVHGHTRCGGVVHRKPEEVAKSTVDASPKTGCSMNLGKGVMVPPLSNFSGSRRWTPLKVSLLRMIANYFSRLSCAPALTWKSTGPTAGVAADSSCVGDGVGEHVAFFSWDAYVLNPSGSANRRVKGWPIPVLK